MTLDIGCIQVYTGNGKGKTTAALGQGIRAYGNGLKVIMVQYLKSGYTGELNTINNLNQNFEIYRFEKERDFFWNLSEAEKEDLQKEINTATDFVEEVIKENKCDMLILDEIIGAMGNNLIDVDKLIKVLKSKPKSMEIILTGRNAPEWLIELADLVTEMKEIKHYYKKGINSRQGIEY